MRRCQVERDADREAPPSPCPRKRSRLADRRLVVCGDDRQRLPSLRRRRQPTSSVPGNRRDHGWLIFALPPAELAAHPASGAGGEVALHLMCDNIETTMRELRDKGVVFDGDVAAERWGLVTKIVRPSGARLGLDEPRQASPL